MSSASPILTTAEIAERLGGVVLGDPNVVLRGFAPARHAREGDLTFAENEQYFSDAESSAASAILVGRPYDSSKKTLIHVDNPRLAFAKILPLFFPEPQYAAGIHATAVIAASAQVDASAHIGPYCVIGEKCRIQAGAVLVGFVHIAEECLVGEGSVLFPHAVVYAHTQMGCRVRIHAGSVIGSDGFGYVFDGRYHQKVPQVGCVILEDDVEIGANVTVDRGALGPTVIGRGTKIDNLVQVGHNVEIGSHCLLVSQVGIAGSTQLGDYVTLAGQVGVAGHLKIGSRAIVAAQSGIMNSIPEGAKWFGAPAQPDRQAKRQMIALQQLPELLRRVSALEKKLEGGGEVS
jgi:UDP-3-O-[3-hydroxymyristoyl] glucosamine N-acyltransferase